MKQGVVIKSTGSWYKVKTAAGQIVDCRVKGKFRIKDIKTTNPITVGDKVWFEMVDETGVISRIEPRKNYIIRKSTNLSRSGHIIAANIDQALLIVTISWPETPLRFIDRFLVTAEAYRIPTKIIFNKIDLYTPEEKATMLQWKTLYEKIGYPCLEVSATEGIAITKVEALLRDKVSVVNGNSGVGKSTIINAIDPNLKLKTAQISGYHHKGKHTTTFSEMFDLQTGGSIIDTPGIKSFGLIDMQVEEIAHYFPEMFERLEHCRFNNCTHTHEPGCAVIQALAKGEIAQSRYESYLSLLDDDQDEKYRQDAYR